MVKREQREGKLPSFERKRRGVAHTGEDAGDQEGISSDPSTSTPGKRRMYECIIDVGYDATCVLPRW